MPERTQPVAVKTGDVIEVEGQTLRDARRLGEIVEILGEPGHVHYRVRWEDGRETLLYPGPGATIRPRRARKR